MKLISRQQAIEQGLTRYFTGISCKHGHISEKLLSNRTCVECLLIKKRERHNRPEIKQKDIERLNNHDKENPHKKLARTRKRQAAKLKRTPNWLTKEDLKFIEKAYALAALKTIETGFPWHVDHIIPLQGRNVSGLHVPTNIQVIPGSDNVKKHNRFDWGQNAPSLA